MNRKQIRVIGADSIPKVTITLKNLAPSLGTERPGTSSQTYIGRDDNNLLAEIIRGSLEQLGVHRYDLAAAMLFRAINTMFPPGVGLDFRRLVAWGVAVGADYTIEQRSGKGEKGEEVLELTVAPFPAFTPVAQQQAAPSDPVSKLWKPGDPV